MRKTNENSLKEVIEQLIDSYRLRDRLNEIRIRSTWEEVMGKAISNRTDHLTVRDHKLLIRVNSAALRKELQFQKSNIQQLMNKALEGEYILDVVIH